MGVHTVARQGAEATGGSKDRDEDEGEVTR
jgi:hypothetical protein